ncbi:hypothetical protein GCM10023215_48490 [Pseudonocardia yuanmonensis]|uniref:Uncharacterized protein n=1 Tax=Pseudonocardia yuanmonensis TaxID=1095914 RepID=A0ABP8X8Z0_9PSEU
MQPAECTAHLLTPDGVRELRFETVPAEDGTVQLANTEPFSMTEGDVLHFGEVALTLRDYLNFRTLGTFTDE